MAIRFVSAVLLLVGSSLALAEGAPPADGAPGGPGGGMRMSPAERFKQLDTNNDGKISLEEFMAMRRGGPRGPGAGGPPPGAGGPPPGAGGPPGGGMMSPEERFKAADTNHDGFLSLDEFTAMLAARRRGGGGPEGGPQGGAPKGN